MYQDSVYNPVFSNDAITLLRQDNLRNALEKPVWNVLIEEVDLLTRTLIGFLHDIAEWNVEETSAWWPEKFSQKQLHMLVNELRATDQLDILKQVEERYRLLT